MRRAGHAVRAFVRDVVPGPTCGCAMTVVNPVHVVRVAKPVAQLEFVHETAVLDCGG